MAEVLRNETWTRTDEGTTYYTDVSVRRSNGGTYEYVEVEYELFRRLMYWARYDREEA